MTSQLHESIAAAKSIPTYCTGFTGLSRGTTKET